MKEIDRLYKEIQPSIYAFFYVKTSNKAVAEDLTSDVFYEACKGVSSFKGKSTLKTWLFSIANNLLKKYYRSKRYQKELEKMMQEEQGTVQKTPEEEVVLLDEIEKLLTDIEKLSEVRRDIVILRIYGELSFKEIGELLGKSENYARVTFHRIKLKLQTAKEEK